jgi:hypothetical protein
MAHADADALKALLPLLRQLREIKGLREVSPGVFHNRGAAFVHFHVVDGRVHADLKKPGGSGFDRYAVDTPPGQRKLVDDAKRRAGRGDDD